MLLHSSPGYSVSVGFSPVVTPGGDYVALGDTNVSVLQLEEPRGIRGSGL